MIKRQVIELQLLFPPLTHEQVDIVLLEFSITITTIIREQLKHR